MSFIRPRKILVLFILSLTFILVAYIAWAKQGRAAPAQPVAQSALGEIARARLVDRGRYLATVGVCEACHTPPAVPPTRPDAADAAANERETKFRTDPDWFRYLDPDRKMAGGVPFILRFSKDSSGIVYTRNLTPDPETGLGNWTEQDIIRAIRTGKRKDGTALFLFPPHSFYKDMAEEDAVALAAYLKSLKPVRYQILERSLPFPVQPVTASGPVTAPGGRSPERAAYLMRSLVGCRECHSHHRKDGTLADFVGGDPQDPFMGSFRLGPDLPLRQDEKGLAAFPYPGYAVLYGGNLTRFGLGGDLSHVGTDEIVRAIRGGISTVRDDYGRPRPLAHVMMWQFYSSMTDDDVYSIAAYIKSLRYQEHKVEPRLIEFGADWEAAFERAFGEKPSQNDRAIFGKQ